MNQGKRALTVGTACIVTYLASYIFRNLLSVYTPQMTENGTLTAATAAYLASVYMVLYAAGQLICGTVGDYVKPKFMVAGGLLVTGTALLIFPMTSVYMLRVIAFGVLGFGLSALRGPLVKAMADIMSPEHTRIACMFLAMTSCLGPLIAGLFVLFLKWYAAFYVSAALAYFFAVFSYCFLTAFEKRGFVQKTEPTERRGVAGELLRIFKIPRFTVYLCVEMITESAMTGITFWIPTYLTDGLGFSEKSAAMIFSGITAVKVFTPFLCLFLLRLLHSHNLHLTGYSLAAAAVFFAAMAFLPNPWVKIVCFLLALISAGVASSTLWSVYLPGLSKYNKISGANGLFDCVGYGAAAATNVVFAWIRSALGWLGVVLSWSVMALIGFGIAGVQLVSDRVHGRPDEI